LALGLWALACSEDEPAPSIPPRAELELLSPGGVGGDAPCVRRGDDPRETIGAEVSVKNFTLRPPLACTVAECGTVRLHIEQGALKRNFDGAERFVSIPTLGLPDGRYQITASLLDTFGEAYRTRDDLAAKCPSCVRTFTLDPTCGVPDPEPEGIPEPLADAGATFDAGSTDGTVDAGAAALDSGAVPFDAGDPGSALDASIWDGGPQRDASVPVLPGNDASSAASPADAAVSKDAAASMDAAVPADGG
jgi:hypothetical protein